jgi:putative Mg2+ transporter-C (MgtC) family protein
MPTTLTWQDVAIRLALTIVGGALLGMNRGEHGRAAGLRTTILVSLAAASSMIQANLLLVTIGKTPNSFVVLDLMRLPLGVLSGMGFIGGGVILRRGNMLIGVTTAATLWYVTAMGLSFGGGQLGLGLALLGIGLFVLSVLKWAEDRLPRDRRAQLMLAIQTTGPTEQQIRDKLVAAGFQIVNCAVAYAGPDSGRRYRCELQWHVRPDDSRTPPLIDELGHTAGVQSVKWRV